ncbi:hypothetical protein [Deinococcus sp.]|uniref:hypothetical protein n=1 Tax=Deinococcus sp. TaxID=47478 RepID=UPI003CC6D90C
MNADRKPLKLVRTEYHTARSSHHVCFECRKQFKKPVDGLVTLTLAGKISRTLNYDAGIRVYPCPQCGQPMTHVGKNFRPPAQDDLEAWHIARRLVAAGFKHDHSSGLTYPTSLKDLPAFLEQHRQLSEGERLLKQWSKDP